jgi:hypothetical protein
MVRLPDQRSADRLPTFSCHCPLLLATVSSRQGRCAAHPRGMHISPWRAVPLITFRRPRGVYLPYLQHPHGPKATRGFNRARACTGPTRPYYAFRNRASPGWAMNCTRDAERGLARAPCSPLLPPSLEPLRPHFRWPPRRAADARPRRRVPRTAYHVTRSSPSRMPHFHQASSPRSINLNASSALRSPVSLQGLTLSLARGGGGGAAPQPPGLSPRNSVCLRALVAAALFLAGTLGSS